MTICIITSTNGTHWLAPNNALNTGFSSGEGGAISWGNSLFICLPVNNFGGYLTSPDGATWSTVTPSPGYRYYKAAWSPVLGMWASPGIGIGADDWIRSGFRSSPFIGTTTDATNWTIYNTSVSGVLEGPTSPPYTFDGVWMSWLGDGASGQFVSVGVGSDGVGNNYGAVTSPDGVNWSLSPESVITGTRCGWNGSTSTPIVMATIGSGSN